MTNTIPMNNDALSELLNNPVTVRLVTVLNVTSQSILEVLEYGFAPSEISKAMAKGVIEFDKSVGQSTHEMVQVIPPNLEMGDYYFELVRKKIRLSKLGVLVLEILEADLKQASKISADLASPAHHSDSLFDQTTIHI
jgi:hypothetical protein